MVGFDVGRKSLRRNPCKIKDYNSFGDLHSAHSVRSPGTWVQQMSRKSTLILKAIGMIWDSLRSRISRRHFLNQRRLNGCIGLGSLLVCDLHFLWSSLPVIFNTWKFLKPTSPCLLLKFLRPYSQIAMPLLSSSLVFLSPLLCFLPSLSPFCDQCLLCLRTLAHHPPTLSNLGSVNLIFSKHSVRFHVTLAQKWKGKSTNHSIWTTFDIVSFQAKRH